MNADQIKQYKQTRKTISEFCFIFNLIRVRPRKSAANLNARQVPRVVNTKDTHKPIFA